MNDDRRTLETSWFRATAILMWKPGRRDSALGLCGACTFCCATSVVNILFVRCFEELDYEKALVVPVISIIAMCELVACDCQQQLN